MNQIQWIFFDVGGVLLDDTVVEAERQQRALELAQRFNSNLTEADMYQAWLEASKLPGSVRENALHILMGNNENFTSVQDEYKALFPPGYYLAKSHIRPECHGILSQLQKHYRLGIIANQSTKTADLLTEAGIMQYFQHQKVSAHHGLEKPDPAYFAEVFQDAGANPHHSAFVDDNWYRGLLPGQQLGMTTILFKRHIMPYPHTANPDYIIETLPKLLDILI